MATSSSLLQEGWEPAVRNEPLQSRAHHLQATPHKMEPIWGCRGNKRGLWSTCWGAAAWGRWRKAFLSFTKHLVGFSCPSNAVKESSGNFFLTTQSHPHISTNCSHQKGWSETWPKPVAVPGRGPTLEMRVVRQKKLRVEAVGWGEAAMGHSRASMLREVEREGRPPLCLGQG